MPIPALLLFAASTLPAPLPAPLHPAPPLPSRHWGRVFISPMGEPFRVDRNGDALEAWFVQADRNHDGYLSLEEMQADAERFFATLDTNHDGEIDPDEMTHYEEVIAPEISGEPHFAAAGMATGGQGEGGRGEHGGHGGRGHHGGGFRPPRENDDGHQGASRFGLLDLPEPVASADADFNRGVSLAEFRTAAGQRFLALDLDHRGQLTLAGLESIRPAPAAQPNRQAPTEAPSDTPSQY